MTVALESRRGAQPDSPPDDSPIRGGQTTDRPAEEGWTVTWLELILLAILVIAGLASHEVIQRSVEETPRAAGPGEVETEDVRLVATRERIAQIETERKGIRNRRAAEEVAQLEDRVRREALGPLPVLSLPYGGSDSASSEQARSLAELEDRLRSREKLLELLDHHTFELLGEERSLRQEVRRIEEALASEKNRKGREARARKTRKVLGYTVAAMVLLLLSVRLLVFLAAPGRSPIRFGRISGGAIVTLAILFGWELPGASSWGMMILLLLVIPFLVRLTMRSYP